MNRDEETRQDRKALETHREVSNLVLQDLLAQIESRLQHIESRINRIEGLQDHKQNAEADS